MLSVQADLEEIARRMRLTASPYAPKVRRGQIEDRSKLISEIRARVPVTTLLERWGRG